MNQNNQKEIANSWEQRAKVLGNSKRSVLLKNLPDFLNNRIHDQHLAFILSAIGKDDKTILDIGCGYGRISQELLQRDTDLMLEGVELSKYFSEHFKSTVGKCYNVPLEEFLPTKKYDVIIIVTVLMYISSPQDIKLILSRLWSALNKDGKIICIEPCNNTITYIRKLLNSKKFEPTGKDVKYYTKNEFTKLFQTLPNSKIKNEETIGILPYIRLPKLHRAMHIQKISAPVL